MIIRSVKNHASYSYRDSKVHGANMGPTWVLWAPCWPPWILLAGYPLVLTENDTSVLMISNTSWKHFTRTCDKNELWHEDVIKWKHFPHYWPFVREIHRSPVNFPHKGQWRGALMFALICVWINGWVNNREAGDLRRYRAHYDVIVMEW